MSNLQAIRKQRGLSQNDLVKLSGVSRSLVCKYESGEKNINRACAETVYKLASALDSTVEELLELNQA